MSKAPDIRWPTTEEGWCQHFIKLDAKFNTDPRSPLHHDNRCTIHAKKETPNG